MDNIKQNKAKYDLVDVITHDLTLHNLYRINKKHLYVGIERLEDVEELYNRTVKTDNINSRFRFISGCEVRKADKINDEAIYLKVTDEYLDYIIYNNKRIREDSLYADEFIKSWNKKFNDNLSIEDFY